MKPPHQKTSSVRLTTVTETDADTHPLVANAAQI